ncbi:MAG: hypothetical protein QXQ77_00515 [Candidatus Aenigmatarchaeota archaeon]
MKKSEENEKIMKKARERLKHLEEELSEMLNFNLNLLKNGDV